MDKKKIIKFVVMTFAVAWIIQSVVSIISAKLTNPMVGQTVFTLGMSVVMFVPLMAVLIVNHSLKGMGWKPKLKGNIRWIFFASFIPLFFVILGAALFFAIFPDLFDATGSYLFKAYADMGLDFADTLEKAGLDYTTYMLVSLVAFIYAPFLNMFVALGEEVGWRGFLYPELSKGHSKTKIWIIGGIIWAAFHFPVMLIAGYEYGKDYMGAMWLGLIVFSVNCIFMGMIHEILYEKTKSIWFPALLHGSINAAAKMPQFVMNANQMDKLNRYMIFGPYFNGIIGMIPMVIIAIIMGVCALKSEKNIKY